MPRYFFDVHDGKDLYDDHGEELPDLAAVRQHALRYAGSLITELDDHFWQDNNWQIDVRDEGGTILFSLTFVAAPMPAA